MVSICFNAFMLISVMFRFSWWLLTHGLKVSKHFQRTSLNLSFGLLVAPKTEKPRSSSQKATGF